MFIKSLFTATILFILLFTGCGKKQPTTALPVNIRPQLEYDMDWASLRWYIVKDKKLTADFDIFADDYYTLVDEAFFTNNVLNKFDAFLLNNNIDLAASKKNDCDKFARGFSFFARAKSVQFTEIQYAMPVADYYYKVGFDKAHAINIAVVLDNNTNQKKLICIEPQTKTIINTATNPDFTNEMHTISFIGL